MTPQNAYTELIRRERERSVLTSVMAVLGWDERTNMPPGGAELRGEQHAMLARLNQRMMTSSEVGELLEVLEGSELESDRHSPEGANIREIRRYYRKLKLLPPSLLEDLSRAQSKGRHIWAEAYKTSNFETFKPHLEKLLQLKRQEARIMGFEKFPYDGLLDNYESGSTYSQLSSVLLDLKKPLQELLQKIRHSPVLPRREIADRDYPIEDQKRLLERVLMLIGFDIVRGRLDQTVHPFCMGISPNDVRITTRYSPRNFLPAFFGALHEAGHGMYEQGLNPKAFGTPMGEAASLSLHESQSRLWENMIGRSRPFWEFFYPVVYEHFRSSMWDVSLEELLLLMNEVKPSFIRVEADEVTYNLHIILRFELEKAMVNEEIRVDEVPHLWNEQFESLFGMRPENDRQGCLQDVHWGQGSFGYFPTYTLGNMYAAQYFEAAKKDLKTLDSDFSKGLFQPFRMWLNQKIHHHGHQYETPVLCEKVTGKKLSKDPFMKYLTSKYSEIYELANN